MSKDNRVGLMGGSFDPIHLGHIQIAEQAKNALDLDTVLFIPSGRPPHKAQLGANAVQRLEMTRLAVKDFAWARASDVEVFRQGTIYTVDTLSVLKEQMQDASLYYIIGADTLLDLVNWRNVAKVCTMCSFVCVRRPGVDEALVEQTALYMQEKFGVKVDLVSASGPDLSSTDVRGSIAAGLTTNGMLPESVQFYIDRENLYRI